MKKILITKNLYGLFAEQKSLLDREDIQVFTASTNDEVLKVHRKETADLIITELELPGIPTEDLFGTIRQWKELRAVSTIIICQDTLAHRERCKQCHANAVIPLPVDTTLLLVKMHQFLNVAPRMEYRAALAVGISGKYRDNPVPFHTENISASGMLIRAEEPLARGDGIFLSFFLPDGLHVSGYGEIVRIVRSPDDARAFLYGVRFTNIDPELKAAIERAVNK